MVAGDGKGGAWVKLVSVSLLYQSFVRTKGFGSYNPLEPGITLIKP